MIFGPCRLEEPRLAAEVLLDTSTDTSPSRFQCKEENPRASIPGCSSSQQCLDSVSACAQPPWFGEGGRHLSVNLAERQKLRWTHEQEITSPQVTHLSANLEISAKVGTKYQPISRVDIHDVGAFLVKIPKSATDTHTYSWAMG